MYLNRICEVKERNEMRRMTAGMARAEREIVPMSLLYFLLLLCLCKLSRCCDDVLQVLEAKGQRRVRLNLKSLKFNLEEI